ncbi:MAG: [FeFe] hydrogenase H-cluster maturation GTPase HydF [Eubacteriales bacterium]|nr:[FeFe] hydrogenase H-cluster maturation GTPase HydF [Eubacteriales bacterium]
MGLNDTPSGERMHIGFFGKRNAGKSSVVNAVTGQELAVVSEEKGTTTDPVKKAMELLPIGPVLVIDTPGFDDVGSLGKKRVEKTREILRRTDVAVLVVDAEEGLSDSDREMLALFEERELPFLIVYNKSDLIKERPEEKENEIYVSAKYKENITELKEKIARIGRHKGEEKPLARDLIRPKELAVLVIPIDSAAPKGRIILPQQQVLRDILEADGAAICVKETELAATLEQLSTKPKIVITDSQVFEQVAKDVPEDVLLTSFSILMARYKGFLETAVKGVAFMRHLKDGDKVLIAEGCTHHRQCDDIGTVKIPRWLRSYTKKNLEFVTCSGQEFPQDLSDYAMVIHCGACMLNEKEVRFRMKSAVRQGVPVTNYGIAIAMMHGILKRGVEVFPEIHRLLEDDA